jgi:pimeloyl-ACP methyl ester carboxylesterase
MERPIVSPEAWKKHKKGLVAGAGILCLIVGGPLTFYASRGFTERHYIVDAAACRMDVVALDRSDLAQTRGTGSVVLFHGIAANKVIMKYLARSFAELGLRVFIPDAPGHGRSPGPFAPALAESCSLSLLRGLAARGMIEPNRTIVAGHSMGGAIALRVAEKFRSAGAIAISPAPMQAAHGVLAHNLLFNGVPKIGAHALILAGQYELPGVVDNARDLAASTIDATVRFTQVPHNTHVSVLFSPAVAVDVQAWAALTLGLPETTRLPSRANLLGCVLGLTGIVLLAGPFIRELVGSEVRADSQPGKNIAWWRAALEVILLSLFIVWVLRFVNPLRIVHLFEGDYLASFFMMMGAGLVLLHFRRAFVQWRVPVSVLLGAAIAALLLHFLVTGWFELTATSAWLTVARWERFPLFFLAAFLFLYGLELPGGPVENAWARYGWWFLLVMLAWHSLALGVMHLNSGEILLVLLSPYFALQFLLSGLGIQLVRKLSGSATAAAVFGAILLAGFCLVLFPVS